MKLGGLLEYPESPSRYSVTRKGERESQKEWGLGNEQPSDQWTPPGELAEGSTTTRGGQPKRARVPSVHVDLDRDDDIV